MASSQHIGDNSDNNKQFHADGDINAHTVKDSSILIGRDNHGVIITSVPTSSKPQHTFEIPKKSRISVPASMIGTLSALITIGGFVTAVFPVKHISGGLWSDSSAMTSEETFQRIMWFLGALLIVAVGVAGWKFYRFLRRNVLRLPKQAMFRAWAGIKEQNLPNEK